MKRNWKDIKWMFEPDDTLFVARLRFIQQRPNGRLHQTFQPLMLGADSNSFKLFPY